jgi:hypothetical protein
MWRALVFAVLDLASGGYLLWYARSRERRRREPVAIVGAFLVLTSVFLVYVAWRSAHPTVHKAFVPVDSTGVGLAHVGTLRAGLPGLHEGAETAVEGFGVVLGKTTA